MKAVLFGSIGTLIETSDIQRESFNQAFKENGLDWYWSKETYKNLLKNSGGSKRIENFAIKNNIDVDSKFLRQRKTEIFNNILKSRNIPPREGVLEIIKYAKSHNIKIGLASSTTIENIEAVFITLNNVITKSEFDFIGNSTLTDKLKPEPDIYLKAIGSLGIDSSECIAIEDSVESSISAIKAKIDCIAFPGVFHMDDDFKICKKYLKKLDISIFNNN